MSQELVDLLLRVTTERLKQHPDYKTCGVCWKGFVGHDCPFCAVLKNPSLVRHNGPTPPPGVKTGAIWCNTATGKTLVFDGEQWHINEFMAIPPIS